MRVDCFDFELPEERIADRPASPRDAARLLEVRPDGLADHVVRDLPTLLRPGDLLVVNDTRVIPARIEGRRGDVNVELTLLKALGDGRFAALARPARRLRPGQVVEIAPDFSAIVKERRGDGEVVVSLRTAGRPVTAALEQHGAPPLPPYIAKKRPIDSRDVRDYQTIFATRPGAVAAPTAGLHFTPELMSRLDGAGIGTVRVTLHVGAGTFLPVKVDDTDLHRMHAEAGEIAAAAASRIASARAAGGRVVAVGTTALRLLESAVDEAGVVRPWRGETDIFITPGFRFRAVDLLITNFHLPRSTLFMLVAAFSGLERMKGAYAHAIAKGYRFYSYGDGCLLHPAA